MNNNEDIEKRLSECQDYHYAQSSKVSTISRTLIFGIIGTTWVIIYSNNTFTRPVNLLIITLCLSFGYLVLDLIHYFWDACNYRSQSFRLDKERQTDGILHKHEEYMDLVSIRSFRMIVFKFILILIISILFVIGVISQLLQN